MQLLLFEYLHANAEWYRDAPDSLRAEGRQMLEAVACDLMELDVTVVVAVCKDARSDVNLPVPVVGVSAVTPAGFVGEMLSTADFDMVFPIAPESGLTLATLVREFEDRGVHVLTMSADWVERFSDKWQTYQFLVTNGVATLPTLPANRIEQLQPGDNDRFVIKPCDGVGCEGVKSVSANDLATLAGERKLAACDHIVQPLLEGQSLSVGLLGHATEERIVILPPATQEICWDNDVPRYSGGEIPASLSVRAKTNLRNVCDELVKCMGSITGYVGVDFFLPDGSDEPLVMEINPRLCSSYVGYRQLAETNLMSVVLGNAASVVWKSGTTKFRCE